MALKAMQMRWLHRQMSRRALVVCYHCPLTLDTGTYTRVLCQWKYTHYPYLRSNNNIKGLNTSKGYKQVILEIISYLALRVDNKIIDLVRVSQYNNYTAWDLNLVMIVAQFDDYEDHAVWWLNLVGFGFYLVINIFGDLSELRLSELYRNKVIIQKKI